MHFEKHPPAYDTHGLFVSPHTGLAFQASPEAPPNKTEIKSLGPFKNWSFPDGYLEECVSQSAKTTKKT